MIQSKLSVLNYRYLQKIYSTYTAHYSFIVLHMIYYTLTHSQALFNSIKILFYHKKFKFYKQ